MGNWLGFGNLICGRPGAERPGSRKPEMWYYLSFADCEFLGAAYVRGDNDVAAIARATLLGINPGGEVLIVGPISPEAVGANIPEGDRERLLSREELGRTVQWEFKR